MVSMPPKIWKVMMSIPTKIYWISITDIWNIDQSTLDISDHFAPFAKLFRRFWVFFSPCKAAKSHKGIEGEKERIIRLLDSQGTLTMEEKDQPNLRRFSLATAWGHEGPQCLETFRSSLLQLLYYKNPGKPSFLMICFDSPMYEYEFRKKTTLTI